MWCHTKPCIHSRARYANFFFSLLNFKDVLHEQAFQVTCQRLCEVHFTSRHSDVIKSKKDMYIHINTYKYYKLNFLDGVATIAVHLLWVKWVFRSMPGVSQLQAPQREKEKKKKTLLVCKWKTVLPFKSDSQSKSPSCQCPVTHDKRSIDVSRFFLSAMTAPLSRMII